MHLEDALAAFTLEVMVMPSAGKLVAGHLARQRDCKQFALLDEGAQVAIDGGQTQTWDGNFSRLQDFLRQ